MVCVCLVSGKADVDNNGIVSRQEFEGPLPLVGADFSSVQLCLSKISGTQCDRRQEMIGDVSFSTIHSFAELEQ